jgi:two-component system, NtrC family, response regulator AtoC
MCPTDVPTLASRLSQELSRMAGPADELSLVIARSVDVGPRALLDELADHLRAAETASIVDGRSIGLLLPRRGGEEALAFARELLAVADGRASAGIATAPYDGVDADTVLGAARAACATASPGSIVQASDAVETIAAGSRRILVADPAMRKLYELARRLARSTIPILILGETGAGKELAAAAVHAFSKRADQPFVSVNCAAIPETLAESELFGHARGAFSGAVEARVGYLEAASGGTLFLDEIGELSPAIQAKLLRVLESGELLRVGETRARTTDLRVVAATNRDLSREVEGGRFRSDLFYRLGSARLELPPLRDRRDIGLLAAELLGDACRRLGRGALGLSAAAAAALFRHDWPGNVRELRNAVEYAAASAPDQAGQIDVAHLPGTLAHPPGLARDPEGAPRSIAGANEAPTSEREFRPIADEVRELERARMVAALRESRGIQKHAAALIDMPLRTFVTKVKRYAIVPVDWSSN